MVGAKKQAKRMRGGGATAPKKMMGGGAAKKARKMRGGGKVAPKKMMGGGAAKQISPRKAMAMGMMRGGKVKKMMRGGKVKK
jgi:hypothetical protein